MGEPEICSMVTLGVVRGEDWDGRGFLTTGILLVKPISILVYPT